MRRLVIGAAALLLLTACSGPDVDTRHREVSKAPKSLVDRGPKAGTYRPQWQRKVHTHSERAGYHFLSGNLVAITGSGLQAVDAHTGKPTWDYREPGRKLAAWAETNGAVVLSTFRKSGDETKDRREVGLDAGTGEVLWTDNQKATIETTGGQPSEAAPQRGRSVSGTVLMRPESVDESEEATGIDARTGDTRWSIGKDDLEGACSTETSGAAKGRSVLPMTVDCGSENSDKEVLAGVDAESGEVRWQRPRGSRSMLTERNGITLAQGASLDGHPELLGTDGKVVSRGEKGASCPCTMQRGGGAEHVLLTYNNAKGRQVRVRVDRRTGKATRVGGVNAQRPTGESGMPTTAGKRSYRLLSNPVTKPWEKVLPAAFAITELTTGRRTYATLPVPSNASGTSRTPSVRWFGVRGDRLFVVRQRPAIKEKGIAAGPAVLSSYGLDKATAPTELGGVSPKDWPDPCSLLNGARVHDKDAYPAEKLPVVGGKVALPAAECHARRPESGDFREVHVRVWWRAATERQAATLFDGLEPGIRLPGGKPEAGADDERRITGSDPATSGGTWLRVGRTVVTVRTEADDPSTRYHGDGNRKETVRTVVANLKKQR